MGGRAGCWPHGQSAGVSPARDKVGWPVRSLSSLYQVAGGTPAVQRNNLTPGAAQCHIRMMSIIKRVCVYCGSNQGRDPRFVAAARRFGEILAANRIGLVYGCGSIGLMGTIARAVHDHGGEVIGIIPEFLKVQERLFTDADEIVITADMHERKRMMFERADAFVALPGGVGTLEEVVEQLTWAQLGRHRKPILIANIAGYWDPLLVMFDHLLSLGFLTNGRLGYLVADNVDDILPTLVAAAAKVTEVEKLGEPERVERL
jgi:uncharacterized protein (TIGR00730 family)